MKQEIFSVFDSKSETFSQPMFMLNKAVAIRSFTMAAKNEEHDFCKFAGDYTLMQIGEFDDNTGQIHNLQANVNLGTALQHQGVK